MAMTSKSSHNSISDRNYQMTVSGKRLLSLSKRLFAVEAPRIYYLVIPKCGCTYVKNILWYVSTGHMFPNQRRVHDADLQFLRAPDIEQDAASIISAPFAFTVLRNPIDRFLSLYFDKVVGAGRSEYVPLASTLVKQRGLIADPTSLSQHQFNLECMIDWIEENLVTEIDLKPEAHWTPQSFRLDVISAFNLCVIDIEYLGPAMENMLSPSFPEIRRVLSSIDFNRSERADMKRLVLTSQLRRRINDVYKLDRLMYRATKSLWITIGQENNAQDSFPRFLDLGIRA